MSYSLGIDVGTTFPSAAICRVVAGRRAVPEVVALGSRSSAVSSVVYLGAEGQVLVGEAAERRAVTDPDRVVRQVKRRIGDDVPMIIVVTHPASWDSYKIQVLTQALHAAGLSEITFWTEPEAAAASYAFQERIDTGHPIAVYDSAVARLGRMVCGVLPWFAALAGRLDEHVIDSVLLRDNPLGDPAQRPLWVYVPPGYDGSAQRYPSVYVIQGYTGQLTMWRNRSPYRRPFPETADAVFAAGDVPPAVVVFVDAWTAYGGSQFVDSPGTGNYHSYLCEEVVPFVDAHYRTLPDRAHRAISGKSSGGFGAMITPMLRPDLFGALASHAGDALYELCYLAEFGKSVRHLRDYDGDIGAWWADFQSRTAFTKPADEHLLMTLGISACFSASEDGTPELPFNPHTGVLRPAVWQRWLDWDPVRMAPRYTEALRSLRAVWLDAGTRDEWYLDLGAQAFRDQLRAAGLPDEQVHFELFDAGHGAIDYRYPLALEWLCRRITGGTAAD